jgi:hypothetical protein
MGATGVNDGCFTLDAFNTGIGGSAGGWAARTPWDFISFTRSLTLTCRQRVSAPIPGQEFPTNNIAKVKRCYPTK